MRRIWYISLLYINLWLWLYFRLFSSICRSTIAICTGGGVEGGGEGDDNLLSPVSYLAFTWLTILQDCYRAISGSLSDSQWLSMTQLWPASDPPPASSYINLDWTGSLQSYPETQEPDKYQVGIRHSLLHQV